MGNADSSKPSLDDARARVCRAKEHIDRLKTETIALSADENWAVTIAAGIGTGRIEGTHRLPSILGILIGEAIYNLRAALDYLVYELALLDSGELQDRTQFPLESTEKGWDDHRATWLRGVSAEHQARIRDRQPFNGIAWTATLRDLSNPDKHRRLTRGTHGPVVTLKFNTSSASQTILRSSDMPVEMDGEVAYSVAFEDGTLVVETLQILQQQVADVIDAFEPEFQ